MALLREQAGRCQIFFGADFAPQVGFAHRLSTIAELIEKKLPKGNWQAIGPTYIFRHEPKHFFLSIDFRRLACQALGLEYWADNSDLFSELFKSIFSQYGVDSFTRVGFKVRAWLDLKMTHDEIRQLYFGSFLESAEKISKAMGSFDDHSLQLDGERNGYRFVFVSTPMTKEQSISSLQQTPNLAVMVENQLMDTSVRAFTDRLSQDGLFVDIDLFRKEVPLGEIRTFLKETVPLACEITDDAAKFLRSIPKKD